MSEIALEQNALSASADLDDVSTSLVQSGQDQGEVGQTNVPAEKQKTALERFMEEPAVRRAAPAVLALLVVLFLSLIHI